MAVCLFFQSVARAGRFFSCAQGGFCRLCAKRCFACAQRGQLLLRTAICRLCAGRFVAGAKRIALQNGQVFVCCFAWCGHAGLSFACAGGCRLPVRRVAFSLCSGRSVACARSSDPRLRMASFFVRRAVCLLCARRCSACARAVCGGRSGRSVAELVRQRCVKRPVSSAQIGLALERRAACCQCVARSVAETPRGAARCLCAGRSGACLRTAACRSCPEQCFACAQSGLLLVRRAVRQGRVRRPVAHAQSCHSLVRKAAGGQCGAVCCCLCAERSVAASLCAERPVASAKTGPLPVRRSVCCRCARRSVQPSLGFAGECVRRRWCSFQSRLRRRPPPLH